MVSGWATVLDTTTATGFISLEQMVAAGLFVVVFSLGFIAGNQR